MKNNELISFVHVSDYYSEIFNSEKPERPTFYWFTDRYFDHIAGCKYPAYKFFYFFIKNPRKDNIEMRARHEGYDFHGLYENYLEFKIWAHNKERGIENENAYCEPAIMNSFSRMVPDLIAVYFEQEHDCIAAYPKKYWMTRLKMFNEDGMPKNFLETELANIYPGIRNSLPFVESDVEEGKYKYENWMPMVTEKNGWWL